MISEGVNKGNITFSHLAKFMSKNPAILFGLYPQKGHIGIGADADMVFVDPNLEWNVDANKMFTKNKWSPFDGWKLKGKVVKTMVRGKIVYQNNDEFPAGPGYGKFLG